MSRMRMAGIFSVLLIFSMVMSAYSSLSIPSMAGFSETDLLAPGNFAAPSLPAPPGNIAGDTTARPDVSVRILIGQVFAEYGGSVRIIIVNNDTRAIFLRELMFEWVGTGISSAIMVNQRIFPKDSWEIPTLAVDGPPGPGPWDYQVRVRLLQFRSNQWYRMLSGGNEWISFSEKSIDVSGLAEHNENPVSHNPKRYYLKTNSLMDFSSPAVASATMEATAGLEPGYDMGKVCAIFDWLVDNINYTEDPDGGDIWYSPDETLTMMAGDCEDYAMLLAAMVQNAGGTSRMYLTRDHAFAAVFVGASESDMNNASADIRAYYRTPVATHHFHDESGYWLVADPLGSFYMGGLAVGQAPTEFSGGLWNTSFPDSDSLFSVDVTGTADALPLWLDPLFWLGMMLVFGLLAIGMAVTARSDSGVSLPRCVTCSGEIDQGMYTCPFCQATYHSGCAFDSGACRACGKEILFPPPAPLENAN